MAEMTYHNRNFRKETADARRSALIDATLDVIAENGVQAASVRTITKKANLAPGLVRYYFESKDDLIAAAYEQHMSNLVKLASAGSEGNFGSSRKRLAMFVRDSLLFPVVSLEVIATWAGFFQLLLHDEAMRASHQRSYNLLRQHIKDLISDALNEADRTTTPDELRRYSIAGNAILDGLWIEGGAIPEFFQCNELVDIALYSFSKLLDLDLKSYLDAEL